MNQPQIIQRIVGIFCTPHLTAIKGRVFSKKVALTFVFCSGSFGKSRNFVFACHFIVTLIKLTVFTGNI